LSNIQVSYTGNFVLTWNDNTVSNIPTTGTWVGAYFSQAVENINCTFLSQPAVVNVINNANVAKTVIVQAGTPSPSSLSGPGGGSVPVRERGRRRLQCVTSLHSSYFHDFEELVLNQNQGNGVGALLQPDGCLPGSSFDFHEDLVTVSTITINNCDPVTGAESSNGFISLLITLFDGSEAPFGDVSAAGGCSNNPSQFSFQPGEMLRPNSFLIMAAQNGAIAYLAFETNMGNSFAVGPSTLNKFAVAVGAFPRYLTGFYGQATTGPGGRIFDLAAYLSYGVRSASMTDIAFDDSFSVSLPSQPTVIAQQAINNPSEITEEISYSAAAGIAPHNCFTVASSTGLQISAQSTFQGMLPAVIRDFVSGVDVVALQESTTNSNCVASPTAVLANTQFSCSAAPSRSCLCTTSVKWASGAGIAFTGLTSLQLSAHPSDLFLRVPVSGTWSGIVVSEPVEQVQCTTSTPTAAPTTPPTPIPTFPPTYQPSAEPSPNPTPTPSDAPTFIPSPLPTDEPSPNPSPGPTRAPTAQPTLPPSAKPSSVPTAVPTAVPSRRRKPTRQYRQTGPQKR